MLLSLFDTCYILYMLFVSLGTNEIRSSASDIKLPYSLSHDCYLCSIANVVRPRVAHTSQIQAEVDECSSSLDTSHRIQPKLYDDTIWSMGL